MFNHYNHLTNKPGLINMAQNQNNHTKETMMLCLPAAPTVLAPAGCYSDTFFSQTLLLTPKLYSAQSAL